MKKIILLAIVFLTVASTYAQQGINYKAIVSDNGSVLQNHAVQVQFSILQDGTTLSYQETHSTTTDANGIIILNIGEGATVSGIFNDIDWSNSQFLKVEIDTGSGYVNFGTTAFKTVPYAKYAENGGANRLNDLSDAKYDGSSIFIGNSSGLNDDATTNYNTGVGHFSLHSNTSGIANTSVGNDALYKNTTGSYNSAFGFRALYENTTGDYNTAYGYQVLYHNTTGEQNTGSGRNALFQNTTGSSNTAYGWSVLSNNTTGYNNTAIGHYVLPRNTTGHSNIALGSNAGFYNVSGSGNIFLGRDAGYNETGSNKLYIENSNSETPLIGGDFSTDQVTINGTLDVSGNVTANLIGDVTGNVEGKITATHSGNSDMKAYIYGSLYATGSLKTGPSSDGFTSIKVATGHYRITFDTSLGSQEAYLLIATASNTTVPQIITCHQSSAYCDIYIWDMSSNPVDAVFNFVVYKK